MVSTISLQQFEEVVHALSQKATFEGKPFDDVFSIGGVSLWWFYNRFITRNMIPFLPSFEHYHKSLVGQEVSSKKIVFSSFSAKLLFFSEEIKRRMAARKNVPIADRPILFLTYTNHYTAGGIYRLQGILELLQQRGVPYLPVAASPFTERPNRFAAGLAIYDFIDEEMAKKAKAEAGRMHLLWKQQGKAALQEAAMLENVSFWKQVEDHCSFLFSREFLYLTFLYYHALRKAILETKTPLMCITANIGLMEKCAIVAGNNLKVPVLHLQHGFDTDFRKTATSQFDHLYFAVFGEEDRKLLAETGVDESRVFPTGGTFFDGLEKYVSTTPKKVTVKKVLLLSQPWVTDKMWTNKQRDDFLTDLEKICAELKAELFIKPHPRDSVSFYQRFTNGKKITVVEDNLYKQIKGADLVVSVVSTTISESVALNKPVLVLDKYNDAAEKAYVRRGVVLYARSGAEALEQLPSFLKFFVGNVFAEKRKRYVADYLYALDGKSKERVVAAIEKLVKHDNI